MNIEKLRALLDESNSGPHYADVFDPDRFKVVQTAAGKAEDKLLIEMRNSLGDLLDRLEYLERFYEENRSSKSSS